MDEETVSRGEYREFQKRNEEYEKRQDKRLEQLEANVEKNRQLAVAVEKLAVDMENMLKEQERQREQLNVLESRDGEKWRTVVSYTLTAVIGIAVGCLFSFLTQ